MASSLVVIPSSPDQLFETSRGRMADPEVRLFWILDHSYNRYRLAGFPEMTPTHALDLAIASATASAMSAPSAISNHRYGRDCYIFRSLGPYEAADLLISDTAYTFAIHYSTNMAPTFALTGVTGKLGSRILENLLETVKPSDIAISARDPSRLASLSDNGHRGAKKLLLVSSSDTSGKGQEHHRNAIKAAKTAGIQMIYYTSHQGASHTSSFWPCRDHAATEDMLEQSGIPYVSLRNGFYMDVLGQFTQSVQYTNAFSAPLDGQVSWTHHDDLAKCAASLMIRSESVPKIVTLVNPKAMDLDEVAKVYTEVKGSEVRRLVVNDEEYVELLKGHGVPEDLAQGLLGIFVAAKEGALQSSDGTLGDILDGKFTDVKQYLKDSQ